MLQPTWAFGFSRDYLAEASQFMQLPRRTVSICTTNSEMFIKTEFDGARSNRFRTFDAGETEIQKSIRDMEKEEERLVVFCVDVLDYHSIVLALKGCSAVLCCLDSPERYEVCYL